MRGWVAWTSLAESICQHFDYKYKLCCLLLFKTELLLFCWLFMPSTCVKALCCLSPTITLADQWQLSARKHRADDVTYLVFWLCCSIIEPLLTNYISHVSCGHHQEVEQAPQHLEGTFAFYPHSERLCSSSIGFLDLFNLENCSPCARWALQRGQPLLPEETKLN